MFHLASIASLVPLRLTIRAETSHTAANGDDQRESDPAALGTEAGASTALGESQRDVGEPLVIGTETVMCQVEVCGGSPQLKQDDGVNGIWDPIPDFYSRRPSGWSAVDAAAFERLYADQVQSGTCRPVSGLEGAKWQFLCWVVETKDVLLHGSNNSDLPFLEPRHAADQSEFGGQLAVYAASDGIWSMFFAIANRRVAISLVNTCFTVDEGGECQTYYYFSINADAFDGDPWQEGTVYILPRAGFVREGDSGAKPSEFAHQWASTRPVSPMASLRVAPSDFPLLGHVHGHDAAAVIARAANDPGDFPWRDQRERHP